MAENKLSFDDYKKWLKDNYKYNCNSADKNYFDSTVTKMHNDFTTSSLWNELYLYLRDVDEEYRSNTGYILIREIDKIDIYKKSFDSLINKTYRKNCLENEIWPLEIKDGWINPNNWHNRIDDILRTIIEVKYVDGVQFLVNKLEEFCVKNSLLYEIQFQAKDVGYYAAHFYFLHEFEIPKRTWDTEIVESKIEIQITTQLQELIRTLLHKYYEENRIKMVRSENWQWDFKNDQFCVNYLGHILHYLEGMILEIRDK